MRVLGFTRGPLLDSPLFMFRLPLEGGKPPIRIFLHHLLEQSLEAALKILERPQFWRGVLAAMLVVLAVVGFWPSPVDQPIQGQIAGLLNFLHSGGAPGWLDYQFVEKTANVALFVPFGVATSLAFPKRPWWQNAALGTAVSGCMELGQLLFLHSRFATLVDVATNSTGAVLGALAVVSVFRFVQRGQAQRGQR